VIGKARSWQAKRLPYSLFTLWELAFHLDKRPQLVTRDSGGQAHSVRYDAVNAMLLNEFLKEHCKVEKLEATLARQQDQIEALTAGLQKVTAQIEMKELTTQIADNQ
jgi:hypothetical protein